VLTDCVPSKTLIAAAGAMTSVRDSAVLGLQGAELTTVGLDLPSVNLAVAQSADIHARLQAEGVRIVPGQGRLSDELRGLAAHRVEVLDAEGRVVEELESDAVLVATGADPRVLPGAEPDGERILDWRDVYDLVELTDRRTVEGSHALMTVGTVPNTAGLNLEQCGVELTESGHIVVDRVSRTSVPGIYAAGDVTGVFQLASVAAMQGRIAMWHVLGEAVAPIKLKTVSANVFTHPEIATVGVQEKSLADTPDVHVVQLPLATNARAKMSDLQDGFVKLFARRSTGVVVGGVVVAPGASELILPIALAVTKGLTVDDLAQTFAIYPSLSGSITEAGRRLMGSDHLA
jgi:pyruvate/2-oxoglutarate dehydrogenase complex dihydrolipoamide dehydrogenase (E3) component